MPPKAKAAASKAAGASSAKPYSQLVETLEKLSSALAAAATALTAVRASIPAFYDGAQLSAAAAAASAPAGDGKGAKRKRAEKKPRALTSYQLFTKLRADDLRAANPGAKSSELMGLAAAARRDGRGRRTAGPRGPGGAATGGETVKP